MLKETMGTIAGWVVGIAAVVMLFGPWVTHIVWCIGKASETGSAIALLIVGALFAPIGWVHGICLWFGFTWI